MQSTGVASEAMSQERLNEAFAVKCSGKYNEYGIGLLCMGLTVY